MEIKECGADAASMINRLLECEGVTKTELAKRLGTNRQNVSQMLTRNKGLKYESFRNMAAALGYEIFLGKKYENEQKKFENEYKAVE